MVSYKKSFLQQLYNYIFKVLSQAAKINRFFRIVSFFFGLQEDTVWAVLAGMATAGKNLQTAEVAYAALDLTDKVHYINKIKVLILFYTTSIRKIHHEMKKKKT